MSDFSFKIVPRLVQKRKFKSTDFRPNNVTISVYLILYLGGETIISYQFTDETDLKKRLYMKVDCTFKISFKLVTH